MRKYFLAGLATLLPLAITVWVAHFILNLLTKPFVGIVLHLVESWSIPHILAALISKLITLLSLLFFIVFLGMIGRWFLVNSLLKIGDRALHKIPFVKAIYKTTKEIVQSLFAPDQKTFQQVVMVPFPYEGSYLLGLIAKEAPHLSNGPEMTSIFFPTAPNPTTGYLIMRPRSELILLDMKPDEAIRYIISCGMALPGEKR